VTTHTLLSRSAICVSLKCSIYKLLIGRTSRRLQHNPADGATLEAALSGVRGGHRIRERCFHNLLATLRQT
jgi:hypothetical protein